MQYMDTGDGLLEIIGYVLLANNEAVQFESEEEAEEYQEVFGGTVHNVVNI